MKPQTQAKEFDKLMELDKIIHERVRLGIMAALSATQLCSFHELKHKLNVTDGNLSVHLKLLCNHGYITVHKSFIEGKPQSSYELTEYGRTAFKEYINSLEGFIRKLNLGQ